MKLFGLIGAAPSAVEQAEQQVERAKEKHAALIVQLGDATRELASIKATAIDDAMEMGRLNDSSNDEIAAAAAGVETLRAAVDMANKNLQEANRNHGSEVDAEQRAKSVREIETLRQDMVAPAADLLSALGRLLPFAKRAGDLTLDGKAIAAYLQTMELELPQGFETVAAGLAQSIENIRSGRSRPNLPQAEVKPTTTPTPQPFTISVVAKHDIKFTNDTGTICYCKQHWDAGLPVLVAERAIAHGVVVDAASDEARALRKKRVGNSFNVDFDRCVDIDQTPPKFPDPLPERWLRPGPTWKYSDTRQTASPLSGWIGRPTPTNSGEQF